MAKTVIGLFQDLSKAQEVVQVLADDGVRREDVRIFTSREGASAGTLTALGVPEAEGRYAVPTALADLERRAGPEPREPPLVLPVLAEALDVQTRRVETGRVRLHKTVQTREVLVDEPLLREEVAIELVPVNHVVEGPIPVRYEGDTMIVSVLEEVLVVETRLLLKEEVHITTRRTESHAPVPVTLRHEDVTVERVDRERNEPHT